MDHTHSWEYLIGDDSKLVYVAPSCQRYTGYTVQEFMDNKNLLLDIAHPDDKEMFTRHIIHEKLDSDAHTLEFRIIDKSGNIRWLSHTCQPLYDNDGSFLGRRASNHEITDYKEAVQRSAELSNQLGETSTLLNAILDAIPDVIGVQDLQHNIIRYNKAGYDFIGKEPADVHCKKCYALIGHEAPCEVCATSEVYKTGKTARREKFVPELDRWLDVRAYPVRDENGNLSKVVEHLRDISREKKAEADLMEAHERIITILDSIEAHV
ncbi:MAG: PAS domain-containing protein, partial [Desulfobulbia bacterium]